MLVLRTLNTNAVMLRYHIMIDKAPVSLMVNCRLRLKSTPMSQVYVSAAYSNGIEQAQAKHTLASKPRYDANDYRFQEWPNGSYFLVKLVEGNTSSPTTSHLGEKPDLRSYGVNGNDINTYRHSTYGFDACFRASDGYTNPVAKYQLFELTDTGTTMVVNQSVKLTENSDGFYISKLAVPRYGLTPLRYHPQWMNYCTEPEENVAFVGNVSTYQVSDDLHRVPVNIVRGSGETVSKTALNKVDMYLDQTILPPVPHRKGQKDFLGIQPVLR